MDKIKTMLENLKVIYKKPIVIIATVGVLTVAGVGCFFLFGNNKSEDISINPSNANVVNNNSTIEKENETISESSKDKETVEDEVQNNYSVIFYDYDKRTVLQEKTEVARGGKAVYSGTDPFRKESVSHTYEFSGWDKPLYPIEEDTCFYAIYSETEKVHYNVTFYDDDQHTVLQQKIVYEGQLPSYTGETPVKDSETMAYTFSGWNKNFDLIYADTTYIAKYSSRAKKEFEVTFYNEDGSTLQAKRKFYEGSVPVYYYSTPTKSNTDFQSFEFAGWEPSLTALHSDISYYATYIAKDLDGIFDFVLNKENVKLFSQDSNGAIVIKDYFIGDGTNGTKLAYKYKTVKIGDGAYYNNANMQNFKKVTLPNTITCIGVNAFANNQSLKTINIPKSIEIIDVNAFSDCINLAEITYSGSKKEWINLEKRTYWDNNTGNYIVHCTDGDLPKSVNELKNNGGALFSDGVYLTWNELLDSDNATKYSYNNQYLSEKFIGSLVFENCLNLIEIYIPKTVISISGPLFAGCSNLKTIVVDKNNQFFTSYNNDVIVNKETKTLISACANSTIPSNVENIGTGAFSYLTAIKNVVIPSTVKTIKDNAFKECFGLESITIPSSVTSLGNKALYNCYSLKTMHIKNNFACFGQDVITGSGLEDIYFDGTPDEWNSIEKSNNDFSEINIHFKNELSYGYAKFRDGNVLTWNQLIKDENADYYDYDNYSINNNSISAHAFENCEDLVYINIPSAIKDIHEDAFNSCVNLKEVVFSEGLQTIGTKAFYNTAISKINIPSSVNFIGYGVFAYCSDLKNIVVNSGNQSYSSLNMNVIIDNVRNCLVTGCSNSKIPNNIVRISDYAFYGINLANTITIPDSVNDIGYAAFYNNETTSVIHLSNLSSLGDFALYSNNLSDIYFNGTREQWNALVSDMYGGSAKYYNKDYTHIHCLNDPETGYVICTNGEFIPWSSLGTYINGFDSSSTEIAENTFKDNAFIQEVSIPIGVNTIGEHCFENCENLKKVILSSTVSNIDDYAFYQNSVNILSEVVTNEGLQSIGIGAFKGCSKLANFIFPSTLQSINSNAFESTGLLGVDINGDISLIGDSAFANCAGLAYANIGIDNDDNANSAVIGESAFDECINLSTINIGDDFATIGDFAFCATAINSLYIPENITSIGVGIVSDCDNLVSIYVDEDNAMYTSFGGCNAIVKLSNNGGILIAGCSASYVPYNVSSIGQYAFDGIESLESITISNSLQSLSNNSFNYCINLSDIYYEGISDEWYAINKGSDWLKGNTNTLNIHCLDQTISLASQSIQPIPTPVSLSNLFSLFAPANKEEESSLLSSASPVVETSSNGYEQIDSIVSQTLNSDKYINTEAFSTDTQLSNSVQQNNNVSVVDANTTTNDSISSNSFSISSSNRGVVGYSESSSYMNIPKTIVGDGKNGTTSGVTYTINTIGGKAFEYCTNLQIVTIENGIIAIENDAFRNCSSLVTVNIPDSVTSIGDDAFYNCGKLTSINYSGTKAQWNSIEKWYNWSSKTGSFTINCSDGSISK